MVRSFQDTGAVRHGAECFNYYFPQDLDAEYLVIWHGFEKKPWTHLTKSELQTFLLDRIDDDFSFPLNPKWVLCDAGPWRQMFHKLLESETARESLDAWLPGSLRDQLFCPAAIRTRVSARQHVWQCVKCSGPIAPLPVPDLPREPARSLNDVFARVCQGWSCALHSPMAFRLACKMTTMMRAIWPTWPSSSCVSTCRSTLGAPRRSCAPFVLSCGLWPKCHSPFSRDVATPRHRGTRSKV